MGQITQTQFSNLQVKLNKGEVLSQAMAPSSDGGYFEASRRNGNVEVVNPASGSSATLEFGTTDGALLTKRDADGIEAWGVGFEGNVSIQKIAATPNGGAIVGGVYQGAFNYINADGKEAISTDKAADMQKLFVLELQGDGKLARGRVLLPKHEKHKIPGSDIKDCCEPTVEELMYEDGKLKATFQIGNKVTFGGTTFEAPLKADAWSATDNHLYVELSWPGFEVSHSFQMYKSWDRTLFNAFGMTEVSSLKVVSDGQGGSYVARSFFGQVDEIDNLSAMPKTVEYSKGKEKLDSTKHIIVDRRGADGKDLWSKPLNILVSNYLLNDNQKSDATVNYVSPIGAGSRVVVAGFFAGKLGLPNGTTLESAVQKGANGQEGYAVDAYVAVCNATTGALVSAKNLGLQLRGYIYSRYSKHYSMQATIDGENLILAFPLQYSATINGVTHTSMDGGDPTKYLYNTLFAQISLHSGKEIELKGTMSLTHVGKVKIDGLVKGGERLYRYIGIVESSENAAAEENTKLYLNGNAIEGGIANAKEGKVSIAGAIVLSAPLQVKIKHPEEVVVKVQKNSETPVTYQPNTTMPTFIVGDKLKVTAELKAASKDKFRLLPIKINGAEVNSGDEYTFDGSKNEIEVEVGAYKTVKPILVTITPAGSAKVKLKVNGEEKEFTGDKSKDPQMQMKNGEGAFELTSVELASGDDMVKSIKVQGKAVGISELPYAYAKLPENDTEDFLRIDIEVQKVPEFPVEVKVLADFTYGKVTVTPEGAAPIVFEGDPTKHPALKARYGQQLTIKAEAASGYRLESLKVGGAEFKDGAVYTVPKTLASDKLSVEATFSVQTAVESKALTTVSLRSNIASDAFELEGTWSGELRYTLYNTQGVLLRTGHAAQAGVLRVEIAGLQAGVYLLHAQDATGASVILRAVKPY